MVGESQCGMRSGRVRRRSGSLFAFLIPLAVAGCAGAVQLPVQPFGWQRVSFAECPPDVPGAERAECALVEVPLDWDDPSGLKIVVFVRRFLPSAAPEGQLWALDGGPGEPGDGLSEGAFVDAVLGAGFELIVPTHRGNAYGTTLQCPGASDEAGCVASMLAQWGTGLRHFEARQAARDVAALASAHPPPRPGTARIFGGSYGTLWLQRTLQVAPGRFHGAFLDSAGSLDMNFERIGEWFEAAGRGLLSSCDAEPACASRFPDGALAAAARVRSDAAQGQGCVAALGAELVDVQGLFARLLQGTDERALVAPLLYRLERCSPDDQRVLRAALAPAPPPQHTSPRFNPLLNWVATYRAVYRTTLSLEELDALAGETLFDNGAMLALARRRALFPSEFDEGVSVGERAAYGGPLQLVQGALDPLTPPHLAEAVEAFFPAAGVRLVTLAQGGHASPRFTQRESGERCTMTWLAAFLREPEVEIDLSCLDDVAALDLAATHATTLDLAEASWGVRDAWDGAPR